MASTTPIPMKVDGAKKFNQITYMDVLKLGLKVMDSTAISLCKDNDLPIIIFSLNEQREHPPRGAGRENRIDGERVE